MFDQADQDYMRQAIELARRGLYSASPNPRVGCVLVKEGHVIGRGWHRRAGMPHAEIEALNDCRSNTGSMKACAEPQGATAYVTLEPCSFQGRTPPCTDALLAAGVSKVIVGNTDPNPRVDGLQKLRDAGVEVLTGCESDACATLNPGFFSRMQRSRPWVRVKLAMSLDGRTALANGESKWITGEVARQDVQLWRAQADCILTGVGTVLRDDPQMTVRLSDELYREHGYGKVVQPLLAIADSEIKTPEHSALFDAERPVVFYASANESGSVNHGEIVSCPGPDGGVDLGALLQDLATREINEVHVEAGAALCASLLKQQLVDELLLYVAPHVLGADAKSLFDLTGLTGMHERVEFTYRDVQQVGDDLRLRLSPAR